MKFVTCGLSSFDKMHVDSLGSTPLLAGSVGTEQTLYQMAALVRRDAATPLMRQTALDIVRDCGGHQFACEVRALFEFCRDQITYRRDPVHAEWVQDAARTLYTFRSGDCDDKVCCLATLLGSLGHKSRFVVIGASASKFTHVYLECATPGGWLALDPTPETARAGWQARGFHRWVYPIWDEQETSSYIGIVLIGVLAYFCFRG